MILYDHLCHPILGPSASSVKADMGTTVPSPIGHQLEIEEMPKKNWSVVSKHLKNVRQRFKKIPNWIKHNINIFYSCMYVQMLKITHQKTFHLFFRTPSLRWRLTKTKPRSGHNNHHADREPNGERRSLLICFLVFSVFPKSADVVASVCCTHGEYLLMPHIQQQLANMSTHRDHRAAVHPLPSRASAYGRPAGKTKRPSMRKPTTWTLQVGPTRELYVASGWKNVPRCNEPLRETSSRSRMWSWYPFDFSAAG